MPIGGRAPQVGQTGGYPAWPANLRDTQGFPEGTGYGQTQAGAAPGVEYRFAKLTSSAKDYLGNQVQVATLGTPGQGVAWVLERILIGTAPIGSVTPTTGAVLLIAGDLQGGYLVDWAGPGAAPVVSSSDPQPIRLPAGSALNFVWEAGGADQFNATVQYRVEPA